MCRSEGPLGLVNGRQEILPVLAERGRAEIPYPREVAIGALGHHGEFGGNCGQITRGHIGSVGAWPG